METYIYTLKLIPRLYEDDAWTSEEEACVNKHFLRLKNDFNRGIVLHAGRTQETKENGFGIVIFKSVDLAHAIEYMKEDPAVQKGLMIAECQPYRVAIH